MALAVDLPVPSQFLRSAEADPFPDAAGPTTTRRGRQALLESRRYGWAEEGAVGALDFGMTGETEALDGAFRLVHDQYVWRGYMDSHPSGRRLSLCNAVPSTKVFVAQAGGRVVGTVTLVQDSLIGLPMDEIYREELATLRRQGRRLAEVSALAMDPGYRASGVAVLMRLVRMLVLYAAEIARLDDLCIAVNPRHVEFYRKELQFRLFGELKDYRKVNGAPAVALRLNLDLARALIDMVHAGRAGSNELYGFLFGPDNYRGVIARLRQDLPRSALSAGQFAHFFGDGGVLAEATAQELAFVQSLYSDLNLSDLTLEEVARAAP